MSGKSLEERTKAQLSAMMAEGPKDVVSKDNLGRFVKGVSGNPNGRPKGSKNRATIMRAFIEEALVRDAAPQVNDLLDVAMKLAKSGDVDMLKLLLGDFLRATNSKAAAESEAALDDPTQGRTINVVIQNYTGQETTLASSVPAPIDAEFVRTS